MQNTRLLQELRQSAGFPISALVIGFPQRSELVYSCEDNPSAKLDRLLRGGGTPVGVLKLQRVSSHFLGCQIRPLEEWKNDPQALNHLHELKRAFLEQLKAFAGGLQNLGDPRVN